MELEGIGEHRMEFYAEQLALLTHHGTLGANYHHLSAMSPNAQRRTRKSHEIVSLHHTVWGISSCGKFPYNGSATSRLVGGS